MKIKVLGIIWLLALLALVIAEAEPPTTVQTQKNDQGVEKLSTELPTEPPKGSSNSTEAPEETKTTNNGVSAEHSVIHTIVLTAFMVIGSVILR